MTMSRHCYISNMYIYITYVYIDLIMEHIYMLILVGKWNIDLRKQIIVTFMYSHVPT